MTNGPNEPRLKGVADIVFVLDVSRSMNSIIEALKAYIDDFATMLLTDAQSTVKDTRLGLVIHGLGERVRAFDFVSTAEEFRSVLLNAVGRGQEFGLPAVDLALDFPWRDNSRRYIVFFSDEPVRKDGNEGTFQVSREFDVCQKMSLLHVHFIGFSQVDCPSYSQLGKTPGSSFSLVPRDRLQGPSMRDVLLGLAKEVSVARDQACVAVAPRNIYGLGEVRVANTISRSRTT